MNNNNRVTKSTENLRDKSHNESTHYESSAMKTPTGHIQQVTLPDNTINQQINQI